jgi:hypothetical protein
VEARRGLDVRISHPSDSEKRSTLVEICLVSGGRKQPALMINLLCYHRVWKERPRKEEAGNSPQDTPQDTSDEASTPQSVNNFPRPRPSKDWAVSILPFVSCEQRVQANVGNGSDSGLGRLTEMLVT